jgi:hypothetical protein
MQALLLSTNKLTGTLPFAHSALFGTRVYHCTEGVRVVLQVVLRTMMQVMQVKICSCVVPTWQTGQAEFKVFMKKNVPACSVYV